MKKISILSESIKFASAAGFEYVNVSLQKQYILFLIKIIIVIGLLIYYISIVYIDQYNLLQKFFLIDT